MPRKACLGTETAPSACCSSFSHPQSQRPGKSVGVPSGDLQDSSGLRDSCGAELTPRRGRGQTAAPRERPERTASTRPPAVALTQPPRPPALAVPAGSGRALLGLVEREGFRKVLQVLVQTFFKKVPLLKRSYLLHCELSGVAAQVLGCQADFACCFCCKIDVAIVPLPLSSMQELNVMFS